MATSVKDLINSAARRTNLPVASSFVTTPTDFALQYLECFYETCEDMLSRGSWSVLKKNHSFTTDSNDEYALPSDFWTFVLDTQWDTTNQWKLKLETDASFTEEKYWFGPSSTRTSFRIFGSKDATPKKPFEMYPVASGLVFSFDYISSLYLADTTGATRKETITVDTDICLFPDMTVKAGWKYFWLKKKGQDTSLAFDLYERLIARTMHKDIGPVISQRTPHDGDERFFNTDEGNWNV